MLLVLQRWIGAPDFPSERAGIGLTSLKRKRSSKMLIIQCPSLALQACGKRLPRHRWHSRRRLIQRRSINWRDAASAACDCFAGVLGTRSPDHARGYARTPRDPGLRKPRTSTLQDHEPCQRMQLSPTLENAPCSADPSQKGDFAASSFAWARRAEEATCSLAHRKSRQFRSPPGSAWLTRLLGKESPAAQ
jgi:hypothetical protein